MAKRKFAPPDNNDRANWAEEALMVFTATTGGQLHLERDDMVADLLCDLGHYCDRHKLDFDALVERAKRNWHHEQKHPLG